MMANNYQYSKEVLLYFSYASSAAMYGRSTGNFIEEGQREQPLNVYGYFKFLFDQYVRNILPQADSQI